MSYHGHVIDGPCAGRDWVSETPFWMAEAPPPVDFSADVPPISEMTCEVIEYYHVDLGWTGFWTVRRDLNIEDTEVAAQYYWTALLSRSGRLAQAKRAYALGSYYKVDYLLGADE